MKKLIIHAGTHKTGTTSIQTFLFEQRNQLAAQGYHFFCARKAGDRLIANAGRWVPNEGSGRDFRACIDKALASRLAQCPGETVVISAEGFSYLAGSDCLSDFRDALARSFSSVEVVFYLRRQDELAVSHFQQAAKSKSKAAMRFYGNTPHALPEYQPHFEAYFDYDRKIRFWQHVFGDESVSVRVFERAALKDNCVVADFVDVVGLPVEPYAVNANESLGRERTLLGQMMNGASVPSGLQAAISNKLDDSGKLMPARADAHSFYQRFRETNRALNERLRLVDEPCLFNDDFCGYPEVSNATWDHDSASAAFGNIFAALNDLTGYDKGSVATLRNAANALWDSDPELAEGLLRLALHARPNNAAVRGELKTLSAKNVRNGGHASATERIVNYLGRLAARKSA